MMQDNKNIALEHDEKDTVFTPANDLQIIMQGGLPVSVIVPMEEYDKMAITIEIAQELLEGKDFLLADGTKGTFEEMIEQRLAAERKAYEEELAAMFEEDCDLDVDCDEEEEQN
jgi:hypothetical protein